MLRIMIIDNKPTRPEYVAVIRDMVPSSKIVYFTDGAAALELMEKEIFDIIITDIPVRSMDGLSILKYLFTHQMQTTARKFVLTNAINDEVVVEAFTYGADFFMVEPYPVDSLIERVLSNPIKSFYAGRTFDNPEQEKTTMIDNIRNTDDMDQIVSSVLLNLGVTPNLRGYGYVKDAIKIVCNNPLALDGITKIVYPDVAKHFNTTSSRVERAIRHMIEKTWTIGTMSEIDRIFGSAYDPKKGKPTNSEFIATICEYLRNNA